MLMHAEANNALDALKHGFCLMRLALTVHQGLSLDVVIRRSIMNGRRNRTWYYSRWEPGTGDLDDDDQDIQS